jgi:hypothetical protein
MEGPRGLDIRENQSLQGLSPGHPVAGDGPASAAAQPLKAPLTRDSLVQRDSMRDAGKVERLIRRGVWNGSVAILFAVLAAAVQDASVWLR